MIRTCQPPIMSAAIPDFDNAIMSDLNNLTSVHADQNNRIVTPLPEHAKCIATLPSYLGGIGLSNICSLATAGWTSAWMMSFQFIKSHLPNIYRVATFIDIDADDLIKLKIIPSDAPDPNRAISNLFVGDKCPSQKELAETVQKTVKHNSLRSSPTPTIKIEYRYSCLHPSKASMPGSHPAQR